MKQKEVTKLGSKPAAKVAPKMAAKSPKADVVQKVMAKPTTSQTAQIEVFPHGVTAGMGPIRPMLIFKDKEESQYLPIWLDPMDVNALIANQNHGEGLAVRRAYQKLLEAFGASIASVYFDSIEGKAQYASLALRQSDLQKVVRVTAAEGAWLGLTTKGCQFFTNNSVLEASRGVQTDFWLSVDHVPAVENRNLH